MSTFPVETFPALEAFPFCRHLFIQRIPEVDAKVPREEALVLLAPIHTAICGEFGFPRPVTAEQVHGNTVAVVDEHTASPVPGADGLITNRPGVCLGIYVADCGAVYLLDPVRRCIGLVHSGKQGTALGIVPEAVKKMRDRFGSEPRDLVVQIGPCIRPPHYEIDFAAEIAAQFRALGVTQVHDCGACTASDPGRYYSYRAEAGKTGRMLALLALLE